MHNIQEHIAQEAIGIFDSGIGGLTVAAAIQKMLPNENIIYVGDTLHMPYGSKKPEEILNYTDKIVSFLIQKKVKLIVIACNTASAIAASELRRKYWKQVEIIGVIRPVLQHIQAMSIKSLGIIGTQATIDSHVYIDIAKEMNIACSISQIATPQLASLIEENKMALDSSKSLLTEYLSHAALKDKEALLLACTHYPLIKKQIDSYYDGKKIILDNAGPIAQKVRDYLSENHLLNLEPNPQHEFYVSKLNDYFKQIISLFYEQELLIKEIEL
ncbi:MAG: glutamate racemase [Chitinophagaceae bacterium]